VAARALVWNNGGGLQSTATAVLISQGRLPTPDVSLIVDTGREDPRTWDYMRNHVQPMLSATVGVTIQVAPHSLAKVDLYSHKGTLLLPVFTATGKLSTYCSEEWKAMVARRYLRSLGYGPAKPVIQWIGYSLDEVTRIKASRTQWTKLHWPLIMDVPLTREQCRTLVLSAGLPDPPKSSCYICPHRSNAQWRDLRDNRPDAFRKACALDDEIRAADTKGGVYLHRTLVPLADADLSERPKKSNGPDLFDEGADDCKSGMCFV